MGGVKKYKELSCPDVGANCNFMVRAATEEEVLKHCYDHGCRIHGKCDVSPEIEKKVNLLIKNVWIADGRFLEG